MSEVTDVWGVGLANEGGKLQVCITVEGTCLTVGSHYARLLAALLIATADALDTAEKGEKEATGAA